MMQGMHGFKVVLCNEAHLQKHRSDLALLVIAAQQAGEKGSMLWLVEAVTKAP